MKIIDRYVLFTFVKNYLLTLVVLIGMYVALDMVFNFGTLTQTNAGAASMSTTALLLNIADYYFYQSFVFFAQLSGMIAAVAAGFTFMRLSRFNEMTAILAAGVPLLRVSAPVILAGVALNLILLPIDHEIVIPHMIGKLQREHEDVNASSKSFHVNMMQDGNNGLFNAAMYTPASHGSPPHIDQLDVIQRDANLRPLSLLTATSAVWNNATNEWDLTDGRRVPISSPGASPTSAVAATPISTYRSDITPEEISLNLGRDYIQLLPITRIDQLLARSAQYGIIDLLRTKHARFAQPIVNIILLLLAISTVLTRQPEELHAAAMKSLALTGLCMGCAFVTYQVAGSPPIFGTLNIWAALMAWLPIFIFGPLAVYLLDQVRS